MSRLLVTLSFISLSLGLLARCSANDAAAHLLGVPSPSVQAERRVALMEALPNATIVVLPFYFADRDKWMPATDLAELLKPHARQVIVTHEPPHIRKASVPPTSYRYAGKRTAQYERWLASNPQRADYIFVPEIYTVRVPRSQLFVLAADGTLIAGSSVHWGGNLPADLADAATRIVDRFLRPPHMQPPPD